MPKIIKKSFCIGDQVLVEWKKVHYKSKIINIDNKNGQDKYLIHYIGYNQKFDEWVDADRIENMVICY